MLVSKLLLAGTRVRTNTDDEYNDRLGTVVKTTNTVYMNVYMVRLDGDDIDRKFVETELDKVETV